MQLPLNKIRTIAQKDDEYMLMSKQASVLVAKATELFLQDLGGVCGQIARQQKRKTLQLQDLLAASNVLDRFHFIKGKLVASINKTTPKHLF
jgi:histone H3/H4